jgi:hypothetical protein
MELGLARYPCQCGDKGSHDLAVAGILAGVAAQLLRRGISIAVCHSNASCTGSIQTALTVDFIAREGA